MQISLCDERWLILKLYILKLYILNRCRTLWTLQNKTSRDGTWKAHLWPTWAHPDGIPSGMGNLEIYNDLVANSSGAIFADSCAGLNALCWLGRKDSSEGGHRRLRAPADLPSVATWRQELCEERDVCSLPTSPAVGTISLWSQQREKVWFYCRRSDWTFSLFTHRTPRLVFLKPSVLVPQNTTLSVTGC